MTYLLDTNVISESVSAQPNDGVMGWLQSITVTESRISAITVGEIKRGIEKLEETHPRKRRLNQWLENEILNRFLGRILVIDSPVMLAWGMLVGKLDRQGRTQPLMDALMAAQALSHQLILVTRNDKDFQGTGVKLLNPWQ